MGRFEVEVEVKVEVACDQLSSVVPANQTFALGRQEAEGALTERNGDDSAAGLVTSRSKQISGPLLP